MLKKIILPLVLILAMFLGYVSTKPSYFLYERNGIIRAPAAKIFPYISQFKMGVLWSPYEQKDLNMKRVFGGIEGQVGSFMEFDGNSEVGAGRLEILKIVPNQLVEIKLSMTKPMAATNTIQYKLTEEGAAGTRFSWSMSGDGGFLGKLMTTLIDCEKMVAGDFEKGITNLKSVVESSKN